MKDHHEVALWSGIAALCGSLLAAGIFDIINAGQWIEYVGALIVAFVTGILVYAKERLNDAKAEREEEAKAKTTHISN
jgi:uncharacterized membrane protein